MNRIKVKEALPEWHTRTTGKRETQRGPWPFGIAAAFVIRREDRCNPLFEGALTLCRAVFAKARQALDAPNLEMTPYLANACPYEVMGLAFGDRGERLVVFNGEAVAETEAGQADWHQVVEWVPDTGPATLVTGEIAGRSEFMNHSWRPKNRADQHTICEDLADPRARDWPGYRYDPATGAEGPPTNMTQAERAAYCKEFEFKQGTVEAPRGERPPWKNTGRTIFS